MNQVNTIKMITLLNGDSWLKEELITQMYDDNFYYNTLGVDKALSTSSLSQLLDSQEDFLRYLKGKKQKESDALRMGKLVHWAYLEPKKFYSLKFVDTERTNSKAYTEAVQEYGAENVFKEKEQRIAEHYIDRLNNKEKLKQIRKNCEVEVPAIKELLGIPIRGKADMIDNECLYDLKTTRVNPSGFNWWKVRDMNYDLQAFIYCQLFERDYFAWIPLNKMNSRVGIRYASRELIESGEEKFYKAIEVYKTKFQGKTIEEIEDALSMDLDEDVINKP